jgi:hypothetical protein
MADYLGKIFLGSTTTEQWLAQIAKLLNQIATQKQLVKGEISEKDKNVLNIIWHWFVNARRDIPEEFTAENLAKVGAGDLDDFENKLNLAFAKFAYQPAEPAPGGAEEQWKKPENELIEKVKKLFPSTYKKVEAPKDSMTETLKFIDPHKFKLTTEAEWIKAIMSTVAFQGFDWRNVLGIFVKRGKEMGFSAVEVQNHLRIFAAIAVERGPAFFKRKDRWGGIPKDVKEGLESLAAAYGLSLKKGGLARDDLTLNRLIAVIPSYIAEIMRASKKTPIASGVGADIHDNVRFPGAATMIPSDDQGTFDKWFESYKAFSKVINPNGDQSNLGRFATAIWKSDLYNDTQRKALWAEFNKAYV